MQDKYSVLGNPISHSLSPSIHKLFAEQTNQSLQYTAILVSLTGFSAAIEDLKFTHRGLNITAPFKQQAFAFCQKTTPRAQRAKSVNTLIFPDDAAIIGDNTDGIGLIRDLKYNLKYLLTDKTILILGTGGAARGIIGELQAEAPQSLHVISRSQHVADNFAAEFAITATNAPNAPFDLIINTTPEADNILIPELPDTFIATTTFCYDMNYTNPKSAFIEWSKKHKAGHIQNGLGMLVEQAAESFYLWRNVRPDTAPILRKLRQA